MKFFMEYPSAVYPIQNKDKFLIYYNKFGEEIKRKNEIL